MCSRSFFDKVKNTYYKPPLISLTSQINQFIKVTSESEIALRVHLHKMVLLYNYIYIYSTDYEGIDKIIHCRINVS
jgi:hypothetical protein